MSRRMSERRHAMHYVIEAEDAEVRWFADYFKTLRPSAFAAQTVAPKPVRKARKLSRPKAVEAEKIAG